MYCLIIDSGAPPQETAKLDGDQWCPRVRADTDTGELGAHRVSRAAFEALGKNGNRERGRVGHPPVHVVGFAVELDQLDTEDAADARHGVSQ